MNQEIIENIIRSAIDEKLNFSWWLYILLVIMPFVGGYFGAYLKKKAENLSTKEDYELILAQLKKTTSETEGIKAELTKGSWMHQQNWSLKVKYYSELLEALNIFKMSLLAWLEYYDEPDSVYMDDVIIEKLHFKNQVRIGSEAFNKIQQLHGPAELVISESSIKGLQELYNSDYHASNFSVCNKENLDEMYKSVNEVYKLFLDEARIELEISISKK